MNQTLLGTKMGAGTSILAAITAWLPNLEAALRIGASVIAIVAGIYAILNYHADLQRKKQNEKDKSNTRTGDGGNHPGGLHDD